jgi:hypothetical protein
VALAEEIDERALVMEAVPFAEVVLLEAVVPLEAQVATDGTVTPAVRQRLWAILIVSIGMISFKVWH